MADNTTSHDLVAKLFAVAPAIRYVAVYPGEGRPELHERPGVQGASASESDLYEELLVNPTILKLAHQRGSIDCGGLEYVLIRYGNFYQLVHPWGNDGHVSVAIEKEADVVRVVDSVRSLIIHT